LRISDLRSRIADLRGPNTAYPPDNNNTKKTPTDDERDDFELLPETARM